MFGAIGHGMLFGLALCFSLGPAFFALIQSSLRFGYKAGIAMSIGVIASDLIYLALAYFGMSGWLLDQKYALPVGILGGGLLITYGVYQVLKKVPQPVPVSEGDTVVVIKNGQVKVGGIALKGFFMNLVNPLIVLMWIGAISFSSSKFNGDGVLMITFFTSALLTLFGTDTIKALAAGKIKTYLNDLVIHKINVAAGIIFIISGVVVIVRLIVEKPWLQAGQ